MLLCCKNNPNLREKIKNQACNCCSRCSGMCPLSIVHALWTRFTACKQKPDIYRCIRSRRDRCGFCAELSGTVYKKDNYVSRELTFSFLSSRFITSSSRSVPSREREREREREKEVTMWEITETERFQREREYQWESTERKIFKMSVREGKCQWDNENVSERVIMSGK